MKIIKIVLITLSATQILVSAQAIPGCFEYYQGACQECYLRKSDPTTKGCGPLNPTTDNCEFYGPVPYYKQSLCKRCKQGFRLVYGKYDNRTCVKGAIQHCVEEIQISSSNYCIACGDKRYFFLNSDLCLPATKTRPGIPYCLWGGFYNEQGPTCKRCEEGYTVYQPGICRKTVLAGCLKINSSGYCLECDVFNGYSMQPDNSCVKVDLASA